MATYFDEKIKQLYEELEAGQPKKNPADKTGW
jgi:hypothetical protein